MYDTVLEEKNAKYFLSLKHHENADIKVRTQRWLKRRSNPFFGALHVVAVPCVVCFTRNKKVR